jgi:hypothetical protein
MGHMAGRDIGASDLFPLSVFFDDPGPEQMPSLRDSIQVTSRLHAAGCFLTIVNLAAFLD